MYQTSRRLKEVVKYFFSIEYRGIKLEEGHMLSEVDKMATALNEKVTKRDENR